MQIPASVAQWANALAEPQCSGPGLPDSAAWVLLPLPACRVRFSACYEIKFSGRYRGFACVLLKLWQAITPGSGASGVWWEPPVWINLWLVRCVAAPTGGSRDESRRYVGGDASTTLISDRSAAATRHVSLLITSRMLTIRTHPFRFKTALDLKWAIILPREFLPPFTAFCLPNYIYAVILIHFVARE